MVKGSKSEMTEEMTYNAVKWNVWTLHGKCYTVEHNEQQKCVVKSRPSSQSTTRIPQSKNA